MTSKADPGIQLLTVTEVAETLSISEKTVRRLIDAGELPVIKLGRLVRIDPRDLDRFIASHRYG